MKSTIRLFKALPIKIKKTVKMDNYLFRETVKRGFVFSPEVLANYSKNELLGIVNTVEKEIGLTAEKMNASFHKSWGKVATASDAQLFLEQILHYFTTYGFERLGVYNESSVYIPREDLNIPSLKTGKIDLVIIRGYTKVELKKKVLKLLQSGIALAEQTVKDVVDVATFVDIDEDDLETTRNKEVKAALYDYLGLFPKSPVEFLRFLVYKSTNKTLLIKNETVINEIKEKDNLAVLGLLKKYDKKHGIEKLAQIFYRFKPIFLAFRTNKQLKVTINQIRRLAVVHHKPMPEDYLNTITGRLKWNQIINKTTLAKKLAEANIFRKIRLAYALQYRTKDFDSILYRIRNGKGYATDFEFDSNGQVQKTLDIVLESVAKDIAKNVRRKKIYIPEHVTYTLPATEKQFTGYFPSGTSIFIPKDMIVGIHWENLPKLRVDLDLSMINATAGKIGWDSMYRYGREHEGYDILFSGDVTDAPLPKGARELFYIKRVKAGQSYILYVNNYTFSYFGKEQKVVPFKILVASEEAKNFEKNYTVNPNNVKCVATSAIQERQKIIGLLTTTKEGCRFYFAETAIGNSITSSNSEFSEHSRKYLFNFYESAIKLNDVLVKAGAKLVDDREECDIDLSPERIEKDTFVELLKSK